VTTAATLWFSSILGMAFGSGQYFIGFLGAVIALVTLVFLHLIERALPVRWHSRLVLVLQMDSLSVAEVRQRIEKLGLKVKGLDLDVDLVKRQRTVCCEVRMVKSQRFEMCQKAVADFTECPGVVHIRWS